MTTRARITSVALAAVFAPAMVGAPLTAGATHLGTGYSAIRGRVIDQGDAPIGGICVSAYHDQTGEGVLPEGGLFLPVAGTTTTRADGTYAIERLSPNDYRIKFEDCLAPSEGPVFLTEWWDNRIAAELSERVQVPRDGSDQDGIDAVLTKI